MKVKPYPKTKPSGIEWLGDVPEHWEVKRGRFEINVNPPSPRLRSLKPEDELSFVPMDAVGVQGGLNLTQTKILGETSGGYTEFQDGDVVVAKITPCFENGKAALASGLVNGAALGTTELHVLRAGPSVDETFLFYTTLSNTFQKLGESEMYGAGGQKRVPPEFCKDYRAPLPPPAEQTAIAGYLDREAGRIDELVGKKRALIERLKEKRTALISRTVTRGLPAGTAAQYPQIAQIYAEEIQKQKNLRPSAKSADQLPENPPLKPSGIDWLGNVPEHWVVTRLDFVACVKARLGWKGLTASEYVPDGYIFLSTPNIKGEGEIDFTNVNFITADRYYESPEIMLQVGDVLIAKDGSTLGTTNVVRHLPAPATVNSSIAVLRPKSSIDSSFFFRWLTGAYMQCVIDSKKDGQGVPHLFQADIKKFSILLPPLPEQLAIAAYLDEETARLDALIAKVETAIERLQEYRTALITAAVTGKIDVREEVAV